MEMLKEAAPTISRGGVLHDAHMGLSGPNQPALQAAAQGLGLKFQFVDVRTISEIDQVFAAMSKDRGGVVVPLETHFSSPSLGGSWGWPRSTGCRRSMGSARSRMPAG